MYNTSSFIILLIFLSPHIRSKPEHLALLAKQLGCSFSSLIYTGLMYDYERALEVYLLINEAIFTSYELHRCTVAKCVERKRSELKCLIQLQPTSTQTCTVPFEWEC